MKQGIMAILLATLVVPGAASAQVPPRTRGTIVAITGNTVEIQPRRGDKIAVHLEDKTPVVGVAHAQLSDVKPGWFIGTTTVPQPDGTLKALEIHVFPESMRGVGEGHYDWDLGDTSAMTNGSVGTFTGSSGRMMTVNYKGGDKTVVVPEDVAVVELHPGDRALMKVGAHALIIGPKAADGSVSALGFYVGENGIVPPM